LVAKWTSPAKDSVTGVVALLDGVEVAAVGPELLVGGLAAPTALAGTLLPVQAGRARSRQRAVTANHVTGCTDRTPGV
jgi:hypothetical protein